MPRSTRNTGSAARGRAQIKAEGGATAPRRTATAKADDTATTATEAQPVDRKAAKRGRFERPSGIDPTIDATAGDRALKQQRELATT